MDKEKLEQLKRIAVALETIALELGMMNEEGIVVFKPDLPNEN